MINQVTVALAGNPNCGKTLLFNLLTGSRQKVGNWPGVTVEHKSGSFVCNEHKVTIVDLPGTYSLSVSGEGALDERLACDYLLSDKADIIINILDASNLERNLYLTTQLLELGLPVIIVANMLDIVAERGISLDLAKLESLLGCPVVGMVAKQRKGLKQLKAAIDKVATEKPINTFNLPLPKPILLAVERISQQLTHTAQSDWFALRLLENDHFAEAALSEDIKQFAKQQITTLEKTFNEEPDILIADARYCYINQLSDQITKLNMTPRKTITQYIDKLVLNKYLGIPLFFFIMYLMFVFAINVGGAFQDFFDIGSNTIFVDGLAHLLLQWHCPVWLIAILANGIGKGINTVVTFAPIIGAMFLFLALLEDSGYMARAAFVMDRFMRAIGLPGRSFVPMIVGFGCNVPAVMGARSLANRRDRILTVMMMPFMSCGARLAIFSVFASAFFYKGGQNIIFLLYLSGIFVAVLTGFILRKTLLPGEPAPLIMELPPYHVPRLGSIIRHAWHRLKSFLFRAGKMIVPVCVLIGVLNSVSVTGSLVTNDSKSSLLSAVGKTVTPILAPIGVSTDNWPATVGLTTGILAKEVVVGTLNTLYSQMDNLQQQANQFNLWQGLSSAVKSIPANLSQLSDALKNPILANEAPHDMNQQAFGTMVKNFDGQASAFAYLLFVLLYFPCISTLAAMRREVGRAWGYFSLLWSTVLAYGLAVICYQLLTISRHPIHSLLWSIGSCSVLLVFTLGLKMYARKTPSQAAPSFSAKLKSG